MDQSENITTAENSFKKIKDLFPNLAMTIDSNDKRVMISMIIPKQPGLDFEIYLNLQNKDELHICTDDIWCQFFPINSQDVLDSFNDAVQGLIEGRYRILQLCKRNKVFKSALQKPSSNSWITIYNHFHKIILPWTRLDEKIIQNKRSS
jgi:hypothetical protein